MQLVLYQIGFIPYHFTTSQISLIFVPHHLRSVCALQRTQSLNRNVGDHWNSYNLTYEDRDATNEPACQACMCHHGPAGSMRRNNKCTLFHTLFSQVKRSS